MSPPRRVVHLTSGHDSYTRCFVPALQRAGLDAVHCDFSGYSLLLTCRRGDVVHVHWPSFLYYDRGSRILTAIDLVRMMLILRLLKLRGAALVWTAHNLYPHDGGKALRAHRVARAFIVRNADLICVHGTEAGKEVTAEFGVEPGKLLHIQHGHWIDYYANTISRAAARAKVGLRDDEVVFSFIGQCKPYKNLEGLCRAFGSLPESCRLLIVGRFRDKAYRSQIDSLAAATNGGRILIEDRFVPDDELQVYLNASDLVVLPYREVLTSGGVMLALSFGRPVVAANFGFLKEVVSSECGELFDPHVPGDLERALERARTREFDSARIRERAASFDWDASASVYASAIGKLR